MTIMDHNERLEKMMKELNVSPSDQFKEKSFQNSMGVVNKSRKKYQRLKWSKRIFTLAGSSFVAVALVMFAFQLWMVDDSENGGIDHSPGITQSPDGEENGEGNGEDNGNDQNEGENGWEIEGEIESDDFGETNEESDPETYPGNENNFTTDGSFSGGVVSDGQGVKEMNWATHGHFDRLVFHLYEGAYGEYGDTVDIPSHFEVHSEHYPFRLVYSLMGVRSATSDMSNFASSELFGTIHSIPTFDDAMINFALTLQQPVEYNVFELHEAARIVTDVRPVSDEAYDTVFSLRTASLSREDNIEGINSMQYELKERAQIEELDRIRLIQSGGGSLFVEWGYYHTSAEAERIREQLRQSGIAFDLHIEERGMFDTPANLQ